MLAALVPADAGQLGQGWSCAVHRVVGQVRIGDMPLHSVDDEPPVERATSTVFDHIADACRAGGLANHAPGDFFVARLQRFDDSNRTVHRRTFLIAGE